MYQIHQSNTMLKPIELKGELTSSNEKPIYDTSFGQPTSSEGNIVLWEYENPNPWTKILFNSEQKLQYFFYTKLQPPSIEAYKTWSDYLPNIGFDSSSGELILNVSDEAVALSILNLMLNYFENNISFEKIKNENLLELSINKSKKHPVVKNKLREQINSILFPQIVEPEFELDTEDSESDEENEVQEVVEQKTEPKVIDTKQQQTTCNRMVPNRVIDKNDDIKINIETEEKDDLLAFNEGSGGDGFAFI